jgi:dipeptidyl aminopeptidase/acylaminoacyl peptidase
MMLTRGTRLGPYEIVGLLGTGGMGEVYRARDPRLDRDVAVKVLASAPDAASLRRFEQEARAAAALNHPNILVIYDFGAHNDQPFVVSELLEGETLRDKLSNGSLPLKKAVDYANQIASGLAAAHAKGIVHRDLKPANLFVTTDGRVKILDFGIAVLVDPREVIDNWSTSSTTQFARVASTIAAGTVNYMSPEQVRGQPVDHRSDIFSFGVVLYEMLSGRHAFDRSSPIETMSAAVNAEPDGMADLLPKLPPTIQLVLLRCLEKNPDDRFQSTRDLCFALRLSSDAVHPSGRQSTAVTSRWRPSRRMAAVPLVAGAALVASFLGGTRLARFSPPTYQQLTFRRGAVQSARFAGDGHTIVYGAAWDGGAPHLYATRRESPESRPLPIANAELLAISRAGEMAVLLGRSSSVYARSGGTLAVLPLDASAPREVLTGVEEADWAPDGDSLAVTHIVQGRYRLEYPIGNVLYESGGRVKQVRVSPDGTRVAFVDHVQFDDDRGTVCVVARSGGTKEVLSEGWSSVSGLAWAPSGKEIWFTAATFGAAASLYGVDLSGHVRSIARSASRMMIRDIDRDGRVLLIESSFRLRIGAVESPSEKQRDLTWLDGSVVTDVSGDGGMLLINEQAAGGGTPLYAVYVRKTDGSPGIRIGDGSSPALSPDGTWAAAFLLRSPPAILLLPTGVGQARTLNAGNLADYQAITWFPDGRRLLLAGSESGRRGRLWTLNLPDGGPKPASPEGFRIASFGRPISPDGTQVAAFDGSGRLWLLSLTEGQGSHPVDELEASTLPIGWSSDGRSLYVFKDGNLPATVYRFDFADRRKEQVAVLAPPDLAGVLPPATIVATPDGKSFFYTYVQNLSDLFLLENLR